MNIREAGSTSVDTGAASVSGSDDSVPGAGGARLGNGCSLAPPTCPDRAAQEICAERSALRRAAGASFIGNFVEWFDYASYGFLATVIARVFFPETDSTTALLATFAVFAVSFVMRPIGGIFWGSLGDRKGRRWALSWSILLMSGATFLIALLPGYATIGLAAPVLLLLLRMVQGFSASGEYAGAAAFLAEYAPAGRRGLYTCFVPASTATGLLAGSLFVTLLHATTSDAALDSWGWRIPFLLAGPLGLVGRYIRVHLEDSPKYREMAASADRQTTRCAPVTEVLRRHRGKVAIAFGVTCLNAVAFYLLLSYMPTYLVTELGMREDLSFLASTISLTVYIAAVFAMGHLSDRFGRRRMLILACVLFIVLTVPLFTLLQGVNLAVVIAVEIAFGVMLTANDGTLATFLAEIFPTRVRYSGFALSFNAANALFGGTAPFVATWLIQVTGSAAAPAWYLTAAAVLALGAMIASRETAFTELAND
ncbi:MFS transporter [Georgenia sp. M64]|uniref:MFS transporter n=1 Tax=Georgenia sp. M64 TaxID=3120520 RepID=UPI0030E47B57